MSAALLEFEAPIDAQLRSCLESILLKLSGVVLCVVYYFSVQCTRDKNYTGTSEIWRAKKGPTESASVCKQLHALRTLGLCDITGDAVKRIEEASSCGAFIEALQSECVSEFKRCSGPLVVRLLQQFCSVWVVENSFPAASRVGLSSDGDDWRICVSLEQTEVVATISNDQLHKLRSMYIHGQLHPPPVPFDPQSTIHRFIEHVFACVCR